MTRLCSRVSTEAGRPKADRAHQAKSFTRKKPFRALFRSMFGVLARELTQGTSRDASETRAGHIRLIILSVLSHTCGFSTRLAFYRWQQHRR
jgi:hypothetical protein